MTKKQLQQELDRMTAGKYSPFKISNLADRIAWMWKWRKITESEMNSMVNQAIEIMKTGLYEEY